MDLRQSKLTKREWEILELPVNNSEKEILKLIYNSNDNVSNKYNKSISLMQFMKITDDKDNFHYHFYSIYLKSLIDSINKKYGIKFENKLKLKTKKLKTADNIRIKNLSKKIKSKKNLIYDFILLDNVVLFLKKKNNKEYYTLTQLVKNSIVDINVILMDYVMFIIKKYEKDMKKNIYDLIKNSEQYIEKNLLLKKHQNIELYDHQKKLITICKNKSSKLILYQAPTGMGKTLSPVGLVKKNKVIFMCAAKHVGLQLAKSCISMEIPIAIAFGCNDASDIRLHYFAAKDFVKHRKSGQIFKVDNSVGDKVEMIICDIQSYLYAMRYMQSFNDDDEIIWFWDEPTITLDYENHEFHDILKKNWQENEIKNVILSSATLPKESELGPMLMNFRSKFNDAEIFSIENYDCSKTISLINKSGYPIMPHIQANNNSKKLKKIAKYIEKNKTLLRHVDVKEMSRFICYLNKKKLIKEKYRLENYFDNIGDIDLISIKLYYLRLLKVYKEMDNNIWNDYLKNYNKVYKSSVKITTSDAYTLTDGPTIFLAEDIKKLAMFYLKASNIPKNELEKIFKIMEENEIIRKELNKVIEDEDTRVNRQNDKKQDKDHGMDSKEYELIEKFNSTVNGLKSMMKKVELNEKYVPNTKNHKKVWCENYDEDNNNYCKSFTSDVKEEIVEEIMLLNVEIEWKFLLLMGIGVFVQDTDKQYRDIMKKLAQEQKLYLILASSDYIYGTNYNFCHGYLGKDLKNMTQEKMLQAFGRVGRKNNQLDYSLRIRDEELIEKLYKEEEDKMEIVNMVNLFG